MIEQTIIALTELLAIFMLQSESYQKRKYAPLFGLLGQPFWFYASYIANQWGAFILCFFFTIAWLKMIKTYWFNKRHFSNQYYYNAIESALDNLENKTKLDYKDYIKRVLKEALIIT